jgi:hypothetical protein
MHLLTATDLRTGTRPTHLLNTDFAVVAMGGSRGSRHLAPRCGTTHNTDHMTPHGVLREVHVQKGHQP